MTPEEIARIRSTAALIRDDLAAVAHFEGQEFSGRNVSQMFGRLAAAISALTVMVDLIAAESVSA